MSQGAWQPGKAADPELVRLAELNEVMRQRGAQIASKCLTDFGLDEALAGFVEGFWEGSELPEPGSDAEGRFVFAFQCAMAAGMHTALEAVRLERELGGEDAEGPEAAAPAPAEGA